MPLLDVRSGSDFTGGAEGWILLALDFDICASPATNSSAVVAPRVSREDCSWAAITCRVQRRCGSRTRQCRAMSAKCGGTVLGRNNFSLPTGARWLNASTMVTPSDHTSEAGETLPIEISGAS